MDLRGVQGPPHCEACFSPLVDAKAVRRDAIARAQAIHYDKDIVTVHKRYVRAWDESGFNCRNLAETKSTLETVDAHVNVDNLSNLDGEQ